MSGHDPQVQLACFQVGGVDYALDIMRIQEVVQPQVPTPFPEAPPFLEGVINLRGTILPLFDLRRRLGQSPATTTRQTKIIVTSLDGRPVGVVVDAVEGVIRVLRSTLKPPPALATDPTRGAVYGVCPHAGRLFVLLDLSALLTHPERAALGDLGGRLHENGGVGRSGGSGEQRAPEGAGSPASPRQGA